MEAPRATTSPCSGGWNVLVTAREGTPRQLRGALSRLARLRRSGFRNVFLARIDDPEAFLAAVAVLCTTRPMLEGWLGKIVPVERTFPVEPATFRARLEAEATHFLDRLVGRSFHVRIERRGHKGLIDTHDCEQTLGAYLCDALERRGAHPVVEFGDPDVVLAVELVGDTAGMALLTREQRARFPFVKVE